MASILMRSTVVLSSAILLLPLLSLVSALSVHAQHDVEVIPQGDFNDAAQWSLFTQSGYSSDPAEYSESMVADGELSFTHQRAQNVKSMTFWSQGSSTGHSLATASPDSVVSTSSGPEIMVSGFDLSSVEQYPLVSTSLVVAFRITDGLSDDRVEFSMTWNGGSDLIKTYSNTVFQGEVDYLDSPYATFDLDGVESWDWTALNSIEVKLNYESQPPDDATLEVDAVGLFLSWQAPESGFDYLTATSEFSLTNVIDYIDPTLHVSGSLSGLMNGIDTNLSWLRLSIGNDVVADVVISDSMNLELSVPLQNVTLPSEGSTTTFGIGTRLYWDSDGGSGSFVISIEDVSISGAQWTEWDFDPECSALPDLIGETAFIEDSSYLVQPVLSNCSDDRDENLSLTATSSDDQILSVIVEDGHLKVFPVANAHGMASIDLNVSDSVGNTWSDSFWVDVISVNDIPQLAGIPAEVWIRLGDHLIIEPEISDADTPYSELDLDSNKLIASIEEDFSVIITPTSAGMTDVTLTLWDGTDSTSFVIRVNAYSDPDLTPSLLYIEPEQESYSVGEIIAVTALIENLGPADATFISVRCYADQELIGNQTLAIVPAQQSESISFDWMISASPGSQISIRIVVDSSDSILEIDEANNEGTIQLTIEDDSKGIGPQFKAAKGLLSNASLGLSILIAVGLVAAAFILGPAKIRRVQ